MTYSCGKEDSRMVWDMSSDRNKVHLISTRKENNVRKFGFPQLTRNL